MNSLDKIVAAMRTGKYGSVIDPKGNAHVGIINSIMRVDGIVTGKQIGRAHV